MFRNYTCLSLIGAVALTACTVVPENPQQYSQNRATSYAQPAPTYAQPVNASYQSAQSAAANTQDCRRQETNRELIGGAIGGAAGAYAGEKLIGGTKGLVAGAALGGIAGYGIGDISKDCSPAAAPAPSYATSNPASYPQATQSNAAYQGAPTYNTAAAYSAPISCPVGTRPHASSGSCLLDNPNASLQSATFTGTPAQTVQRAQVPVRSQNIVSAATSAPYVTPVAAPTYRATNVTRPSGTNYGGNYRVVTGDTVYSLSRKLCVPVSAIQSSNGLNSNYGIQIGQSLTLPNSQC